MSKTRIVKDYEKLSEDVIAQIKLEYPRGFEKKLIQFKDAKGKFVSALPFETDDFYYLIRMTREEAQEIIEEDDDYNEEGNLTENAKDKLEEYAEDQDNDEYDEEGKLKEGNGEKLGEYVKDPEDD